MKYERLYIMAMVVFYNYMPIDCISQNKGVINNENKVYFGSVYQERRQEDSLQLSNNYRETIYKTNETTKRGDVKMEADISNLITVITSAIAGVYCAVKTIINLIKKTKG